MNSAAVELKRSSSRSNFLHPFKSFSTSKVPRRVEPSPEREKAKKGENDNGRGGFFAHLRRSLKLGHRSSTLSASPQPQLSEEKYSNVNDKGKSKFATSGGGGSGVGVGNDNGGFFVQLRRSFTTIGHRSSSPMEPTASEESKPNIVDKRTSSMHEGNQSGLGKRMKQGLSKPLKVVTESYVGCMMGISEDPRVETLQGMGFSDPTSYEHAFKTSATRRFDRSASSPPQDIRNSQSH